MGTSSKCLMGTSQCLIIPYSYFRPITECVILCIILLYPLPYIWASLQIQDIKNRWNTIKCNPDSIMYYPVASDDISGDITSCVQNVMFNSMGEFLKPLTGMFSNLTQFGTNMTSQLQGVRNIIYLIRDKIMKITEMCFSYIMKVLLIFYKFQIQLRTILSRLVGVILSMVYVMQGGVYLGGSIWNGVPGQIIRALGSKKIGNCFDGDTKIKLKGGIIKTISDIEIGDVLETNTTVVATMKILNQYKEPYYTLPNGVNDELIYVSGTHYVFNPKLNIYHIVELHNEAIKTQIVPDHFYCLITDDNKITIGNQIFWDWEDYKINKFAV